MRQRLRKFKKQFDKHLFAFLAEKKEQMPGKAGREMVEEIKKLLSAGGKRLRPYLIKEAYQLAAEGEPAQGGLAFGKKKIWLPAGMGIEFFHTGALIEDDFFDQADLRRGKNTVWKRKGEGFAVLSASLAISFAEECFSEYGKEIYGLFSLLKEECYAGQAEEMFLRETAEEEKILQVLEMKSARYTFARPLQIGACLGEAEDEVVKKLFQFGVKIGLAFQLKDDLLDLWGEEKFGKQTGGDLAEGKRTLLVSSLWEKKNQIAKKDWQRFTKIFGKQEQLTPEEIAFTKRIFKESGALQKIREKMREMVEEAGEKLAEVPLKNKEVFEKITEFVTDREI